MFEIEELFDLTIDGAFESPEDFNAFATQATPEELYSVMIEGAFESPEELEASFKKKDETDMVSESGAGFSVLPAGEKDTWLERTFGKNHTTDFFGDIYRAGVQGVAQGATVDDALKIFYSGEDVDEEDLRDYISSVQNMESFQPSDEMKEFDEIYQKEGGGIMGFLKGVHKNPTVVSQIFTSSMAAMLNKGSIAAGLGTGAAAGLATGGIATIPGAIFGLSGALETGVSFTEFLKEELGDKDFTEENIKEVLQDTDALSKIRRRAGTRGISIASIDALTAGVASKVGASVAKAGKTVAGATRGVVEAAGGGAGEVAARALAGQEMDVAEIGFEAIGGTATAPLTIGGRVAETGMAYYKLPKYKIRNVDVSKEEFIKEIESATPEEILSMEISVKNDNQVSDIMDKAWKDATIIKQTTEVLPNINKEELAEIVELTKRKELLEANGGEVAKAELPKINNRIKEITNAVQERSTEKVDVQKPTEDSTEVGVRDTEQGFARESAPKGIQEEEVVVEDQEAQKKTLDDGQVVKSAEVFDVDMDGDSITVEVKTNLDGSREVIMTTKAGVAKERLSKDNPMSNADYVTKAYGTIKDSKTKPITEVMSQKKIDRLSSEQKKAIGLKEKLEEVTTEKVNKLVTAPRRITEPFTVGRSRITFNEDGSIKTVVNVKTGKEVAPGTRSKIEKIILEKVIDVDSGEKAPVAEGLQPEQAPQYIADESNNVREVVQAIQDEQQRYKSLVTEEQKELLDPFGYSNLPITLESWKKYGDINKLTNQIKRNWIVKNALQLDQEVKQLPNYTPETEKEIIQDVIEFAINNPSGGVVLEKGKTPALIDLEIKFEKLTGAKPTLTNLDLVVGIEEGRVPVELLKLQEQEKLSQPAIDEKGEVVEGGAFGKKTGPSAKKITATPKKEITVDEAKALKDQIKLEVRAAREAKADQTQRRKALSLAITNLLGQGLIKTDKAKQLIKQISNVDLNKAINIERVLAYVEKTLKEADYTAKLKQAEALRKRIKKLSQNKKIEVNSTDAAKSFIDIDPVLVEDINEYIEQAVKIRDGVTPSTREKVMPALDIAETKKYVDAQKEKQKQIEITAQRELFEDLTGLSPEELSFQEMREIVYGVEQEQTETERANELERKAKAKAEIVRKGLNKAFDTLSTVVNQLIETETDPFTGERFTLTDAQKKLVKDFINIDINKLSEKDAIVALDSLINFATNKNTGGMGTIVSRNEGIINSDTAKGIRLIAKPLAAIVKGDPGISRNWNKYIASLPLMLEVMFKGQSKALQFEKLSGIKEIVNGVAESESYAKKITDQYYDKFIKLPFADAVFGKTKTNPNGEVFNSALNDIERGMFAFIRRSVPGEEQVEFDRRKSLIEQSIERLSKQGGVDAKKAEVYNEVYEKILKDANNVSDVEANVDVINVEAVEWMTDIWSKNYQALSDVNLNIYNKILGKDVNYTPDSFTTLEDSKVVGEIGEPIFDFGSKRISDKKSGVLMDVQRPTNLPKNRIVNLGFDTQNISNLERARIDINTAGAIQKAKGFFESSNFEDIVPNKADRDLLSERVRDYVEAKRGRQYINKDSQKFLKAINLYSGYAVSRTLGGVTQVFKQTIPVLVNTLVNAGAENIGIIGELVSDASLAKFLENSGYPIVNRGLQSSTTLESNNTKIENAAKGGVNKFIRGVRDVQNFWLQQFLVNPDRYVAQASWMMYYMKSLKQQGVDTTNIDWANHDVNKKAGDYAQQQVDRQQNITDVDLQGEVFRSKRPGVQVLRRVLLPFANFLLNQKSRMYSDVTTLFSKSSDAKDKGAAGRSLAGLVAETIVFNGLGLVLTQALSAMSAESEDDKKAKEKRLSNRIKGRAGQAIKDVVSPLPLPQFDGPLISGINALIAAASESDDPYQFFELQPEDAWERLGVLSIPGERFAEWNQMRKMAFTGEYEQKLPFGKTVTRKLKRKGRDEMLANWISYTLYSAGLAPSEVGTIARYNMKKIMEDKTRR